MFIRPVCPKCGCIARSTIAFRRVRCLLLDDGSAGRVVSLGPAETEQATVYVCGGLHEFTAAEALNSKELKEA